MLQSDKGNYGSEPPGVHNHDVWEIILYCMHKHYMTILGSPYSLPNPFDMKFIILVDWASFKYIIHYLHYLTS